MNQDHGMLLRLCVAIVLAGVGLASTHAADLTTLTGTQVRGKLVAITPTGVTIAADPKPITTPTTEIATLKLNPAAAAALPTTGYDELTLVDGSTLRIKQLKIVAKSVEVTPFVEGITCEIPLASVAWWLRSAHDDAVREAFEKVLAGRGKRDLFVLRTAAGLNPLPGTVLTGNEAGDAIQFEREDGVQTSLRLFRATGGLIFNPPPRDVVPPTFCRVSDANGNLILAERVEMTETGLLVTTVSGSVIRYASVDAVAALDFRQGNVRYLAELPAKPDYPPAAPGVSLDPFGQLAVDQAIGGGPITFDGRPYSRGISIPPDVAVDYALKSEFREFRAMIGLPDGPGPESVAMRLSVLVDGRPVLDEVFKRGQPPREFTINVKDAKQIRLAVERVGSLLDGDQLCLAEARVSK